jgi:hypothetical protein
VHTHALHALVIVVEAAGLMFQAYVPSILALVAKLFHSDTHALPSDVADTVTPVYERCVVSASVGVPILDDHGACVCVFFLRAPVC